MERPATQLPKGPYASATDALQPQCGQSAVQQRRGRSEKRAQAQPRAPQHHDSTATACRRGATHSPIADDCASILPSGVSSTGICAGGRGCARGGGGGVAARSRQVGGRVGEGGKRLERGQPYTQDRPRRRSRRVKPPPRRMPTAQALTQAARMAPCAEAVAATSNGDAHMALQACMRLQVEAASAHMPGSVQCTPIQTDVPKPKGAATMCVPMCVHARTQVYRCGHPPPPPAACPTWPKGVLGLKAGQLSKV